ncbi:MAG: hypothetical protein NTY05_03375 [Rhodocyclales bacterium]|nr:hypothetical protein [Rhodocyclales bacterium]
MKHFHTTLLLLIAVLPAPTLAADAEAGLLAIKALGSVNGQALACAETRLAARAKELMLAHAPKTQRFGAAYEEATQEAFLAQTRAAGTCPDTTRLTDRLNQLALRLADTLPVVAPAAK